MPTRKLAEGLCADDQGACRWAWCQATLAYRAYHDSEWGFPVADDRRLF
jgi:DNA-3-methyladenine glycosylase I